MNYYKTGNAFLMTEGRVPTDNASFESIEKAEFENARDAQDEPEAS